MPTAGLDIGDRAIRFVELWRDRGTFKVAKYDKQTIEEGVITGGDISDRDMLVERLSELRKKHNLKFVRVSLPEEKAYLYHTSVPYVANAEEMRQSVQFTIEENVPHEPESVVFDYEVVKDEAVEEGVDVNIVVSVLPSDVVNAYLEVLDASGLRPMSLMVESQAITHAVVPRESHDTYLVINGGEHKTAIYIVDHAAVHFTSTFTTEGGTVATPVEQEFSEPTNQLDESEASPSVDAGEEADTPKNDLEQRLEAIEATKDERSADEDRDAFMQEHTNTIVQETRRVLQYWQSHGVGDTQSENVKKVLVCGVNAFDDSFKQQLSSKLGLEVQTANVWTNAFSLAEYVPQIHARDALEYAAAIGLALPTT